MDCQRLSLTRIRLVQDGLEVQFLEPLYNISNPLRS